MSSYDYVLPIEEIDAAVARQILCRVWSTSYILHQKNLPQRLQDIGTWFTAIRKLQKSLFQIPENQESLSFDFLSIC